MSGRVIVAAWPAVFFLLGLGVWEFQAGYLVLIGYIAASVVVYTIYAFSRRCPWCRIPLLLKPVRFLGIELYVWTFSAPDTCRHCGRHLKIENGGRGRGASDMQKPAGGKETLQA